MIKEDRMIAFETASGSQRFHVFPDEQVLVDGKYVPAPDVPVGGKCTLIVNRGKFDVTRIEAPDFSPELALHLRRLAATAASLLFAVGKVEEQPDGKHFFVCDPVDDEDLERAWVDLHNAVGSLHMLRKDLDGSAFIAETTGSIWQHIYAYARACGGDPRRGGSEVPWMRDRLDIELARFKKR